MELKGIANKGVKFTVDGCSLFRYRAIMSKPLRIEPHQRAHFPRLVEDPGLTGVSRLFTVCRLPTTVHDPRSMLYAPRSTPSAPCSMLHALGPMPFGEFFTLSWICAKQTFQIISQLCKLILTQTHSTGAVMRGDQSARHWRILLANEAGRSVYLSPFIRHRSTPCSILFSKNISLCNKK